MHSDFLKVVFVLATEGYKERTRPAPRARVDECMTYL